ncbi:MAG: His-Xaa-Ser system protein HxsD [Patescibacteria group bacterium]|nr:His-Xaa-Ser system protein HxsD [Patescibacteria group bacterium]MCL5261978.1 His-Xaa-Ser system protein HxsD [Patescibacteria group bacterium]
MTKRKNTVKKSQPENKEIKVVVNPKIYPLEAIYGAAYVFLDRAYVFLDGDPDKKIIVSLKSKDEASFGDSREIKSEFLNELVNYSLRQQIVKRNAKLREYIVGAALLGASGEINVFPVTETEEDEDINPEELPVVEDEAGVAAADQSEAWEEDPMQIAVPWEEKYAADSASVSNAETAEKKKTQKAKK